ncbi:MAG: 4Fe-4S binding protein [Planctomycetota bacterium]|jgi:polyferredoxin
MVRFGHILISIFILLFLYSIVFGIERFPPPDFEETAHKLPSTDQITDVTPRHNIYEYIDVAVLTTALLLSSHLILKKRSRRSVFILMIFSLLYFGFWRKGCICPIGAIQNLVLSVFDNTYAVSLAVLVFFILPLVFTLFFGRTFCASVCPLGGIQDLVLLRPVLVPQWLESALRLFAYIYLVAAILFTATGSAFIICRYDPFISFFRLSGHLDLLILGACFLLTGMFIGRPYCRFICPYGVILRQLSRLSKWKVTITPDECIKCRLCENACPFGAINKPTVEWPQTGYSKSKKLLSLLILFLPVLVLSGGWAGSGLSSSWSRMHVTVRLAERIYLENEGQEKERTDASDAFRATGQPVQELYDEASHIRKQFKYGCSLVGAFIGLIAGLKLIIPSVRKQRTDFQADRAGCLACGRCFRFCPKEHVRLKDLKESRAM